jgi:thiamine pyrophosphate-dependent acetolactate synthase large subunit-like protein
MVALSAAHGYAQATGRVQAVVVHVDVGTQNLGGALHNAARGRVPIFIFSGASPVTLDGERPGSRNEFIHYLQDVYDQRGFVRETTKWTYDVHVGDNIDLVVKRGLQMACSDPKGPVYVMAPREILEQPVHPAGVSRNLLPTRPAGLSPGMAHEIAEALASAHKQGIPLWYYSEQQAVAADAEIALHQICKALEDLNIDEAAVSERRTVIAKEAGRIRQLWREREKPTDDGQITPEYLTAVVRDVIGEEAIVVNETISNYGVVWRHLPRTRPGTLFGSGASSLGWHGGAAIGVKFAHPEKTVVALTGDGSYLFSVPSAVHWVARRYEAPFLTVIYNNGGWKSPKLSTLAVHPEGVAQQRNDFYVSFEPYGELEKVAEAMGGAYAAQVSDPESLQGVLEQALEAVHGGRSAVVNVRLPRL